MAECTRSGEEMASEGGAKSPIELCVSKDQKEKISDFLSEMSKMTNLEKFYLHLKLPPCPVLEDVVKSDSPASGSASRTSTTLNWIQSHYMEDRRVCLPKQEVYNHYKLYCHSNGINPFAMTDFGKILKTAFPIVHDRRLGQRGKSKYFYGGLRRKSTTGDSNDSESGKIEEQQLGDHEEELESLSSQLICEWASCLLGKTFSSIRSLAQYLVFSGASCGKKAALFNMLLDRDSWSSSSTVSDKRNTEFVLQETQALLQRKLLQKEVLKEHKNLLKQQESNQRDTPAPHSTITRLAAQNLSIQPLHSSGAPASHSSMLRVLNVAINNSISSFPIAPARQERSEMSNNDNAAHYMGPVLSNGNFSITKIHKSSGCQSLNELADINKNVRNSDIESETDIAGAKTKQSKLISSKSLEESNQRQPKRNGDFLHNTNQTKNSKRRRCITSLGMTGLKEQSSESVEQNVEDQKETVSMRPVSCPAFNGDMQTFICDMESEDSETIETCHMPQAAKVPEDVENISNVRTESENNETDNALKAENSSSFHFVRKPTVISIKPPSVNENQEPLYCNVNNFCDKDSKHGDSVKKSHHILNSILSSSDSNIPQIFSSAKTEIPSSDQLCDSQMLDSVCDNKDGNKNMRKEAHTLDNAYLLPCQSSRSAFVRVMNGKGDRKSYITPRPRHSSFDDSFFHVHNKQVNTTFSDVNELTQLKKVNQISTPTHNSMGVADGTKQSTFDNFKPIPVSLFSTEKEHSIVTDTLKADTDILVPVSSVEMTSIKSSTSETVQPGLTMLPTSDNSTLLSQIKPMTSKSPVTPPKRQSRSRFTPIRPKLTGCCNLSPQKKDMRPVSTILKEQRARSAQELLVNLASSYQSGIKVQLPPDILGLSSPDRNASVPSVKSPIFNQKLQCKTGKDITVILDPMTLNNPITTRASPLISPQKIISSTPDVTMMPPASSTLSNLLTGPIISETNICIPTYHQSNVIPSSTVTSSHSIPVQSIDSPIIVADTKGTMYSLGMDAGKQLPKVSNLQQLLQGNSEKVVSSGTSIQQNLINVSDIKGHVIGPDARGQTYLLVPNSGSATLPLNTVTGSTNSIVTLSPSKQGHPAVSKLNPLSGISSSALLSELSHLASVSKQDSESVKQPIKHDSTISAFQKCEPNKAVATINSDQNSQPVCNSIVLDCARLENRIETISEKQVRKENSSRCKSTSCDEISDSQEVGEVCLRKRKASKSQDDKSNEKKRQNTKRREVDTIAPKSDNQVSLSVKDEHTIRSKESVRPTDKALISEGESEKNSLKSGNTTDFSDTESLLDLISDSRSMTVKQTVMAINSLKAKMKKSGLLVPPAKIDEYDVSSKDKQFSRRTNNIAYDPEALEKETQRTLHVIRRNASLNLESLESDALLDTEPSLDRHLVEDMKHCESGRIDHKTSVAVAAKTHRSRSADRQKEKTRKFNDHNHLHTISPKALQSYHMLLNEKNKSHKDKKNDKEVSDKMKSSAERQSKQCDTVVTERKSQRGVQRRCVSSVQDILERGSKSKSHTDQFRSQSTKSQSEVDAFDALLSKMHSKQFSTSNSAVRSHSSQLPELPVDIMDFVTESMSSGKHSLEGSSGFALTSVKISKPSKPQESIVARSISVPNTKPDFFNVGQARIGLLGSEYSNTSLRPESQLLLHPSGRDNMGATGETGVSSKNVFLSPIGPAKLARRSSVEKSINHGQADRSMTRTPIEMLSPNSVFQFALTKEKHATDSFGNNKAHVSERHHTKTPTDRVLMSNEKQMLPLEKGYKSPVNRSFTKTPVEKYFIKQSSDPLPPRSDLSFTQREDTSSVQTFSSDGGYSSGSVSQTPNSDFGPNSISQTPISDFGYSSVSPSPVMMSSECGRNISPATIFMPLRSDSALSLNNNTLRSESPADMPQPNSLELLTGFPNHIQNNCATTNNLANVLPLNYKNDTKNKNRDKNNLPQFTSDLPELPSLLESLSSKALLLNEMEGGKEDCDVIKSTSNTKTLMKLLSSSLQSIPTPPISPTSSPPNTLPMTFSLPSPQLSCPASSPLSLSTVQGFILPTSSSGCSSSAISAQMSGRQFGASPHFRNQDLPSPASVTHSYTPSPHILTRPPSSPHQYSSHPSPPFTPCSLRSLPSPRCMTPISHKSLISPRSVTPSSDPNLAPNRFMPIQSSGVLPTSLTTTHTYIQPIRPVVALASASSHKTGAMNNSELHNSVCTMTFPTSQTSVSLDHSQNSLESKPVHSMPPLSSISLHQSPTRETGNLDAISTSEHKPLEANSTLVLSLSGDIGPLSNQGVELSWGNTASHHPMKDSSKRASASDKHSNSMHYSKDSSIRVSKTASGLRADKSGSLSSHQYKDNILTNHNSDQSNSKINVNSTTSHKSSKNINPSQHSLKTSMIPLQSPHSQLHFTKQKIHASSILKSLPEQSTCNLTLDGNDNLRSFVNTSSSSSSRAFKPPLNSSSSPSSVCSFKPVSKSSPVYHLDFNQLASHGPLQKVNSDAYHIASRAINCDQNSESTWTTHPSIQPTTLEVDNLNPATQDELQVTLDVLKKMDSQYFQ